MVGNIVVRHAPALMSREMILPAFFTEILVHERSVTTVAETCQEDLVVNRLIPVAGDCLLLRNFATICHVLLSLRFPQAVTDLLFSMVP